MKKTLFVMTHVGSGWERLIDGLMEIPEVDFSDAQLEYHHPEDLKNLHRHEHRKNDSLAIWCDVILHNKDFSCKLLCDHCHFIYWHSSTYEEAEHQLLKVYEPEQARRYYDFRTVGLWQYFQRTPGAVWNPSPDRDSLLAAISGRENYMLHRELFS